MENTLYVVLTDYINKEEIDFPGNTSSLVSRKKVRNYIKQQGVDVNGEEIFDDRKSLSKNDFISIPALGLKFTVESEIEANAEKEQSRKSLEENYLSRNTDIFSIFPQLSSEDSDVVQFATIIQELEGDSTLIKDVNKKRIISDFFQSFLSSHQGIVDKLDLKGANLRYVENFLPKIINEKNKRRRHLKQIAENLQEGSYLNFEKFIQDFARLDKTIGFAFLIRPLLPHVIVSKQHIALATKRISEVRGLSELHDKQQFFFENRDYFQKYLDEVDRAIEDLGMIEELSAIKSIASKLFGLFTAASGSEQAGQAKINIEATDRKYIYKDEGEFQEFFVAVSNNGDGVAKELELEDLKKDYYELIDYTPKVSILKPGEQIEILLTCRINRKYEINPSLDIICKTRGVDGSTSEDEFNLEFSIDESQIPWEEIRLSNPYAFKKIDDRSKLYGRDTILDELINNVRKQRLDSYKIWGQKRVGKSSIVKTLESELQKDENVLVAHIEANRAATAEGTFKDLCEEIDFELRYGFNEISDASLREKLLQIPESRHDTLSFNGLKMLFKSILRQDKNLKIVLIIDEFDRLNDEFFLPGNLGETFSLGIGKSLKSENRVSIILVGAENMKLLDRQEINYNEFKDRKIDFFDKSTQYIEFEKLITQPVLPHITFQPEAISLIYENSGGNPYFANLICDKILKTCEKNQENLVEKFHVERSVNQIVSSENKSHFTQYWDDGITDEDTTARDVKSDIRKRVLIAYNLAYTETDGYPTENQILRQFTKPIEYKIEDYEVEKTFGEFRHRNIFYTPSGTNHVRVRPKLFESWLCYQGRQYLLSTGLADLEAKLKFDEKEASLKVTNDELIALTDKFTFQNKKLKEDKLRSYLSQFGNHTDQRKVFNLLDNLNYTSSEEITDFIKKSKQKVFSVKEFELSEEGKAFSKRINRKIDIYGFSATTEDNQELFSSARVHFSMSKNRQLKSIENIAPKDVEEMEAVIFLESSFINLNNQEKRELEGFATKFLKYAAPPPLFFLLIHMSKREKRWLSKTFKGIDFEIICLNEAEDTEIMPFITNSDIIGSGDERKELFRVCQRIHGDTLENQPAIVLETHCPLKSIPILWRSTDSFKAIFENKSDYTYEMDDESLRERGAKTLAPIEQSLKRIVMDRIETEVSLKGVHNLDDDPNAWCNKDYIPLRIYQDLWKKHVDSNRADPLDECFDLSHFESIAKTFGKLNNLFASEKLGGTKWMVQYNQLRRKFAHTVKKAPTIEEVLFAEKVREHVEKIHQEYFSNKDKYT